MSIQLINHASHIVLIAHEHPDADSLGSACAFYSHLLRLNKKVTLFCSTDIGDKNLLFLPWSDKICHTFPLDADLAISFDCGSFKRLGITYTGELINFDHHVSNEYYGTHNCINTEALSTTQVLYEWFIANEIKINGKMAQSLYAGLLDDTSCFRDITPAVFQMAGSLITLGANHEACVKALFGSHSLASLRLKAIMLREMQLVCNGRVAVFKVTQKMLEESGAVLRDCKHPLEVALSLKVVTVALLAVELKSGAVKISLRCEKDLNASEILHHHGGGGHASRAGARIADMTADEAIHKIMIDITKEYNETQL
jgi:bifunctional oligoribonuclease and PAP phosphatase NrnA